MDLDPAQLSSLTSSLGDLASRISGMATGFQGSPREDVAADLFDVERHLNAAHRRMRSLLERVERSR